MYDIFLNGRDKIPYDECSVQLCFFILNRDRSDKAMFKLDF